MLQLAIFLIPGFLFHKISKRDTYKVEGDTWQFILNTLIYSLILIGINAFLFILIYEESLSAIFKILLADYSQLIKDGQGNSADIGRFEHFASFALVVSTCISYFYKWIHLNQTPFTENKDQLSKKLKEACSFQFIYCLCQYAIYWIWEKLVFVLKKFLPENFLRVEVESLISQTLMSLLNNNVIIHLSNGKVYFGNLKGADLNPNASVKYIRLIPSASGYRSKDNHQVCITTIYEGKEQSENISITIKLSDVVLISKFDEEVTNQFMAEGNIVFKSYIIEEKDNDPNPKEQN